MELSRDLDKKDSKAFVNVSQDIFHIMDGG